MRNAVGSLAGPKVASAPTMPRALLASPPMMMRESSSPARFETALSPSRRTWLQVTVTPRSSQGVRPRASERPASSARDESLPDSDRAGPRTTSTWLSCVTACSAKRATAHGRADAVRDGDVGPAEAGRARARVTRAPAPRAEHDVAGLRACRGRKRGGDQTDDGRGPPPAGHRPLLDVAPEARHRSYGAPPPRGAAPTNLSAGRPQILDTPFRSKL